MGIGGGINGENSGYTGVVTIIDYFSTLPHDTQGKVFSENSRKHRNCLPRAFTGSLDKKTISNEVRILARGYYL